MARASICLLALVVLAGCAGDGDAPSERDTRTRKAKRAPAVRLVELARFRAPVFVASEPDDASRLYVVERRGTIRILDGGHKVSRFFLDIRKRVLDRGVEQGLLSIAFAPDYRRSRKLYVFYSDNRGDIRVDEYRRSRKWRNAVDRRTRRLVLRARHRRYANHYGSGMVFGRDGMLYVSTGDGGGPGNPLRTAQTRRSLLGKILRIDPRRPRRGQPYRVPRDNPFFHRKGIRRAIWAYGLRNPYRFSFDRKTGDLTVGDVGQERIEEVNFVPRRRARFPAGRGANFGWSVFEGRKRFRRGRLRRHVKPVIEHTHRGGHCSVIGGYVVRDPRLPKLRGRYVYGDFCTGVLRSAKLRRPRAREDRPLRVHRLPLLSSFGEDARGRIYALSLNGGLYRLDPR